MALLREGITGEPLPERPLSEEVRDVQATRRRLAAADARATSEISVEDVLATAYAEHVREEDEPTSIPRRTGSVHD
jgi:hypothetical protein